MGVIVGLALNRFNFDHLTMSWEQSVLNPIDPPHVAEDASQLAISAGMQSVNSSRLQPSQVFPADISGWIGIREIHPQVSVNP